MVIGRLLDAPVSSTGQALLNTKQNKISQGRLIKSGMTEHAVIPTCLSECYGRQIPTIRKPFVASENRDRHLSDLGG